MQFEVVAEHLAFPEGPVVMPDGSIIVVEIAAGRVTRVWGEGRKEVVAVTGGGPNGAALGPDGAIYVCNSGAIDRELGCHLDEGPDAVGRIERIDPATGKSTVCTSAAAILRSAHRTTSCSIAQGGSGSRILEKSGRDPGERAAFSTVNRTAPPSMWGSRPL